MSPDRHIAAVACPPDAEAPAATLRAAQSLRLATALSLLREGLIETDSRGRIVAMNERAEHLTGWRQAEAIGQRHERVLRLVPVGAAIACNPLAACLVDGATRVAVEGQLLTRDGRRLSLRGAAALLAGENGAVAGAMIAFEDCTQMSLLSEELAYRSSHDPVTGLLNRDEFERRLNAALLAARRSGTRHLLGYIDLDQFKVVNDVHGHFAGDEMLRQIAGVFRASLRPEDALARLGGDEFGVLLDATSLEEGLPLLEGLLEAARGNRFNWDGQMFSTTVSMGVVTIDAGMRDSSLALSQADAACYAAKDSGRNRLRVAADDDEAARRYSQMSMVSRINAALDQQLFSLHYQDVVLADAPDKVIYRELLLRIRGSGGELQLPAEFIAAAEQYYMMGALDRWVVEAALPGIARCGQDGIIYAINISGLSLSDEQFLGFVVGQIQACGVQPARLCFEITETAVIAHLVQARRFIERLSGIGCRFALDDFGSGVASFSYLRNLPVHFVKIDGSFVRSMLANRIDQGMVEAINRIGHDMGLTTIAEHVEDRRLIESLRTIGVDWVQGHAISHARPFEDLLRS